AAAGAKVAVLDTSLEPARALARETGGIAVRCDVTSAPGTEEAIREARRTHGPARVLVNCAGIATGGRIVGRDGPLALEEFARTIDVNLNGTFNALRLAAADMATLEPLDGGERGVIVMTASVAAHEGQIGQAAYAASKGGVASLTLPAARELARFGVRVVTISPGVFKTPMFDSLPQGVREGLASSVPFPPGPADPAAYAQLVLHMVENRVLNGCVVRLDGAIRMPLR
ncbi:MAG: SDR family NAD(P)-dependent oxidoreductase, partial [Alphaproteobacteria bacterium]